LTPSIAALQANPAVADLLDAAFETFLPNGGKTGYKAEYDVEASSIKLPPVISVGTSWVPHPRWLLAVDFRYIFWRFASSKINLHASGGNNADFNEINGSTGIDYTVKLDFDDSVVVAAGAAFAISDRIVIRGGYNYAKNGIPNEFLIGNSLATEHHLAIAAGF